MRWVLYMRGADIGSTDPLTNADLDAIAEQHGIHLPTDCAWAPSPAASDTAYNPDLLELKELSAGFF
jgi:hypothetical protein